METQNQSVNTVKKDKIKERRIPTCPLDEEHRLLMRVMFGDEETGEIGMHDMVKEMYSIVTGAKNLIKLFNSAGTLLKWFAGIGLAIIILKGWAAGFLLALIGK